VRANGGSVSGSTLTAVSRFCASIAAAGIRDRFYRLNLFCGTADASLIAVRTPLYRGQSLGGTQFGNTLDTNINFAITDYAETGANGGLKGDGSTRYLNTGLSHNVLPQNDTHAAVYEITRATATFRTSLGARTTSTTGFLNLGTWSSTANYSWLCFEGSSFLNIASSAGGFYVGVVNGAIDSAFYRNGGSKASNAIATTRTPGPQNVFVFALNDGGNMSVPTDARLAGYSLGLKMTDAQVAAYNTAMQAFQAALSRNV
jgi:hypothetical protein